MVRVGERMRGPRPRRDPSPPELDAPGRGPPRWCRHRWPGSEGRSDEVGDGEVDVGAGDRDRPRHRLPAPRPAQHLSRPLALPTTTSNTGGDPRVPTPCPEANFRSMTPHPTASTASITDSHTNPGRPPSPKSVLRSSHEPSGLIFRPGCPPSAPKDGHCSSRARSCLAITTRWISLVPSPMQSRGASR